MLSHNLASIDEIGSFLNRRQTDVHELESLANTILKFDLPFTASMNLLFQTLIEYAGTKDFLPAFSKLQRFVHDQLSDKATNHAYRFVVDGECMRDLQTIIEGGSPKFEQIIRKESPQRIPINRQEFYATSASILEDHLRKRNCNSTIFSAIKSNSLQPPAPNPLHCHIRPSPEHLDQLSLNAEMGFTSYEKELRKEYAAPNIFVTLTKMGQVVLQGNTKDREESWIGLPDPNAFYSPYMYYDPSLSCELSSFDNVSSGQSFFPAQAQQQQHFSTPTLLSPVPNTPTPTKSSTTKTSTKIAEKPPRKPSSKPKSAQKKPSFKYATIITSLPATPLPEKAPNRHSVSEYWTMFRDKVQTKINKVEPPKNAFDMDTDMDFAGNNPVGMGLTKSLVPSDSGLYLSESNVAPSG